MAVPTLATWPANAIVVHNRLRHQHAVGSAPAAVRVSRCAGPSNVLASVVCVRVRSMFFTRRVSSVVCSSFG